MKKSLRMMFMAGAFCVAGLAGTAPTASAQAAFSVRAGDVVIGYSDGYYDRRHNWHGWRNARERRWYQANYRDRYRMMRRDQDRDGIPNRFDRDRDGDGRSNWADRRPDNPYRR